MSKERDLLFRKYIGFYEYVGTMELMSWVNAMSEAEVKAELIKRGWA